MRKRYLLLTLLLPLATMFSSGRAFAQTDAEYEAAMAAIVDGDIYLISTEYEGYKYFLTSDGSLTDTKDFAAMFAFQKTSGGSFKTYGFQLNSGGSYFSNPVSGSYADDIITDTKLNTSTRGDATWETQVFFLNTEGKYAVRACNCSPAASSWNHVGSSFWTVVDGNATYTWEAQYIWEIEAPDDNFRVYTALNNLIDKYGDQVYDDGTGYTMNRGMGNDFGQYSDFDTWDKFYALLQKAVGMFDSFDTFDDYKWVGDGDCPTLDEMKAMAAEADSLYAVILDSEVPFMVDNGYYRIFAHNRYKSTFDESGFVDKAIAASFDAEHKDRIVYATLNRERANFIWKFTKSETGDSILLQNAGMGTYINLESIKLGHLETTADPSKAGYVMLDYAGYDYVEPDGIADDRDIFCIRFAQEPRDGNYFHQNGHSSVNDQTSPWGNYSVDSGKEQDMAFWRRTYDYDNSRSDHWTSEWFLEPVDDAEAEEIIENFEMIKNHDVLVAQNNALRAEVLDALTTAKDVIRTKLITSADQMSSPYSHNDQAGNGRDGGDLSAGVLIDGDASTYWHSAWNNSPEGQHYIELSGMEGMVGDCEFYLRERAGAANDRPKQFQLLGTDNQKNADEDWVEITTIDIPNFAAGAESSVPFFVETAYPYVRVVGIDCDPSYRTFWHAAELQILTVRDNPNSQFVALGQIAQNLEDTYNSNVELADADITVEAYEALLAAYKTFLAGMVDPTELRNAITEFANVTTGVVEGTNPGEWADKTVANDYEALYAEVTQYDKAGRYNATQNHRYAVMLKAMQKSVMEQANGVETNKWYNIMFPTEAMFTDFGFNPTKPGGESKIVDHPDQFGYVVAPGVRTDEMGLNEEGVEAATGNYYLDFATKETARHAMNLYFCDPQELEDPDVSMFRFMERPVDTDDYTGLFAEVKDNMLMALDISADYTKGEGLITSVDQLSSNSLDRAEGNKLEYLIDGMASTYWHSDYHQDVLAAPYLQVAFNEPVSGMIQVEIARRNTTNGHIESMYVMGSNDAQNWTNIGYIETPFTNINTPSLSQPFDLGASYSYLRFILTKRYGTDAGGNVEFDPFPEITSKDDYNKMWTYCHASEFQIYPLTANTQLNAAGKALQKAYSTANKVIKKDASASDFTDAIDAYRTYRTSFNAIEGKSVLPYGNDKAAPVYAIQNKATGLFLNCKGSNNANNTLEAIPTFFEYTAPGFQRSFLHGKNIGGGDCSYLHSQNFDHRFVTWNDTQVDYNSALVLRVAESFNPEELTTFSFYKDIKPGNIYNWCNSVTLTPEDIPEEAAAYISLGTYTDEYKDDNDNIMTGDFLALKKIDGNIIYAGMPTLFIYGKLEDYNAEDNYAETFKFNISPDEDIVVEADTIGGLVGNLVARTLKKGEIEFSGNRAVCVETTEKSTTLNSAVLNLSVCPIFNPDEEDFDFSILLGAEADKADGVKNISTALEKISQPGNVYSMDGKLLRSGATLNSLKSLGRGMYILNGVKVVVK